MHLREGDNASAEEHRKFYDEYNAVLDMPAEYYLETIKTVFQDFSLPAGTWEVEGKLVKPHDIKSVALFTIEGELDDISGSGQTQAAQDLCSAIPASKKKHLTAPKCGHYGIFAGRRWRELICPQIGEFIKSNP
jgi:poly(3-hydroxybutyrate) depolymerase